MAIREAEPGLAVDPRLEEIGCPVGGKSYFDHTTGLVLRQPRYYEGPKGGILAETMGLGKTLISLALILATRGHWPQIPPEYSLEQHKLRAKVASLKQMAAAVAGREGVPWRDYIPYMSSSVDDFDNCRRFLEQNVPSYTIPTPESKHSRRSTTKQLGRTILLSAGTLVVMPLNLLSHWRNEIATHVEGDALKVLYLDDDYSRTPCTRALLSYDVILMTKARLEDEISLESRIRVACNCLTPDANCSPGVDDITSPLQSIHFLRIMVDEGHDFSSFGRKSNAVYALQKLHVDRRWIISGTPSSGLLGVEANTAILETLGGAKDNDSRLVREILESRRSTGLDSQAEPSVRKSVLLQERKDLEKLGSVATDFLNLRPWANMKGGDDAASWKQYIIPAEDGRRKAKSLSSVLETLVIRHRLEDIENDIKLPPLHNRTVYLEPKWHDKMSLNLFILTLAVNAVTSERTDQDYMFQPKNRRSLNQLVTNLRYAGFYWTGFTKDSVVETLNISQKYLDRKAMACQSTNNNGSLKAGDLSFLRRAIEVGESILASPSWTAFSAAHELGLYVDDFPEEARSSWSLVDNPHLLADDATLTPLIAGAPQISKAQHYINTHLYQSDPAFGLDELGKKTMCKMWQEVQPKPAKLNKNDDTALSLQQSSQSRDRALIFTSTQKPTTMAKRTMSQSKDNTSPRKIPVRGVDGLKVADKDRAPDQSSTHLSSALKLSSSTRPIEPLSSDSRLAKTRLSGTASAKLSYLVDRITILHSAEKILIFYEGDNIAFYLAQTLELLDIQFLIYTGSLSAGRKSAYINTFNTTETFRVLLMDVHQAAHGLHIAAASRVFFVNPVWQPTVEAQAIKRAHRIGQKRPVYVETLVLKDTLEDQMFQRRKKMSAQEHHKAEKSLLDDDVMARLIQEADFIPLLEEETRDVRKQMAPLEFPQRLFGVRSSGEWNGLGNPDKDLVLGELEQTAAKKRRKGTVGFAASMGTAEPATPKRKKVGFTEGS
ncbi:MAG: hypothetical protein Q9174_001286 [Haloplaca sp. 1 TL-2023]